ncbi:MAG: L,D-transpeptidase family protein [Bacteroidales bacterium]|nr:L,D-transpeptidase family protein [Bacteroidales bacterium]
MLNDDAIFELDYPSESKKRRFFISIVKYLSLFVFFILLSSYKNPTTRINTKLVLADSFQFNYLVENQVKSIENSTTDTLFSIHSQLNELLVKFYEAREYKPVWINNYSTNPQFSTLINLIDSAAYFGFPYDYFNSERIHVLNMDLENSNQKVDLELSTTYATLKFMLYLKHGIIDKDSSLAFTSDLEALPEILNKAINQDNLREDILSIQPKLVHHQNLLNSLPYFIDLHYSVKYTTPAFIDDKLLAKSLYYSGISKSPVFDSTNLKSEVLSKLESDYNLPKDSILNTPTHEVIVSLLKFKYFQACLNINRLRNLQNSGENYLFVNIPEYKLHVVESNENKESFNVIVGKKGTPTPVLSSNIEKVIANPYWTVPRSIVKNEMIYKIRRDSTYLKRNGFFVINNYEEVVDDSTINWNDRDPLGNKYWLRQINSRSNALGQVKFIFPNNFSVYLHDTPSKRLFKNEKRTYSHGCIRLENPDKLAQYLTNNYNDDKKNIKKLISEKKRQVIDLSEKVKIHIQYITCSGTENSDMVFFNDIYNLDEKEIKAVFPNLLEI